MAKSALKELEDEYAKTKERSGKLRKDLGELVDPTMNKKLIGDINATTKAPEFEAKTAGLAGSELKRMQFLEMGATPSQLEKFDEAAGTAWLRKLDADIDEQLTKFAEANRRMAEDKLYGPALSDVEKKYREMRRHADRGTGRQVPESAPREVPAVDVDGDDHRDDDRGRHEGSEGEHEYSRPRGRGRQQGRLFAVGAESVRRRGYGSHRQRDECKCAEDDRRTPRYRHRHLKPGEAVSPDVKVELTQLCPAPWLTPGVGVYSSAQRNSKTRCSSGTGFPPVPRSHRIRGSTISPPRPGNRRRTRPTRANANA